MAQRCSACGKSFEPDKGGTKLWNAWYCSACFLSDAQAFHKPLRPEDVELLKVIGRELAGLLPPQVFEMILVGFHRRATGREDPPPPEALAFTMGELQRLYALYSFQREMNLLTTWNDLFADFAEGRQREIQEAVRRLTAGGDE